jgi:hypothetical protein
LYDSTSNAVLWLIDINESPKQEVLNQFLEPGSILLICFLFFKLIACISKSTFFDSAIVAASSA